MRMSRLRRWPLVLLIVLAIGMTPWPRTAMAITPQSQTVHITDTHDDGFVTEVGIGIDSALVHILDPGMDIRAFLVFREIEINFWEPLKNATLRLRTSNTMAFDADSSVTIYGISLDDLQLEGWLGPGFIMSAPLTGAHVNVNTSQFYGQAWHEINVTNIVEELIRHYNWDGDGIAGTETGDAIGFIILGAEDETRYFYDYRGNPSLSADLVIHWNHEPPPPSGHPDATYNETYRGYHIWEIPAVPWSNGTLFDLDLTQNFENTSYQELDTGDVMTIVNSTHFNVDELDGMTGNRYYRGDYPEFTTAIALVHLNVTDIDDGGADIWNYPYSVIGYGQGTGSQWSGNRIDLTVGHHYDNDERFQFWLHQGGTGYPDFIDGSNSGWLYAPQEFWIIFMWNGTTSKAGYIVYNSSSMTDDDIVVSKLGKSIDDQGPPFDSVTFWNAPGGGLGAGHVWGDIYMPTGDRLGDTWAVTDENGTIVATDLDDYDDAIDVIEDELGADPQDPDPPADDWPDEGPFTRFSTRMYIFIVGFFMCWGTVWFFAWKRPDGYYLLVGAIFIIMGVGLIIHSVSI